MDNTNRKDLFNILDWVYRGVYWLITASLLSVVFGLSFLPDLLKTDTALFYAFLLNIPFTVISLSLLVVYHFDAFVFLIPRVFFDPIGPNEAKLRDQSFLSGAFGSRLLGCEKCLRMTLTDRRLILRLFLSGPGICLKEVPLTDIARVRRGPKGRFTRDALIVEYAPHLNYRPFMLYGNSLDAWTEAFAQAGVQVD